MSRTIQESAVHDSQRMQCMEVWGGNQEVDRSFEMPGLRTWMYSRPHGGAEGGGDVYFLSSCASGRITRLLLADISGHGKEVAHLALGLRDLMRRYVNVVKQTRFVEGMNRQFGDLSASGAFATALVATFFQPTRRLTLCNAGHPAPLHYDASHDRWSPIEPLIDSLAGVSGTPLGVHAGARYPQVERVLDDGDLVLLFSDAVTEYCDSDGLMWGETGLLTFLNQLNPRDPHELLRRVVEAVSSGPSSGHATDDLTVVLLQATGTATRLSDNLLALVRLLGKVRDHTLWRGPGEGK
jgi:serine phosphatase RsbU (regulator of sigma subunit)